MAGERVQVNLRLQVWVLAAVDEAVGPLGRRNAWLEAAVVAALGGLESEVEPDPPAADGAGLRSVSGGPSVGEARAEAFRRATR